MTRLFILFEHAAGYALFKVQEIEEIGALLPQVEQSVTDLARFGKIVKLHGQVIFESAIEALDSVNCISEGVLPEGLKSFLELHFPKVAKKSKYTLGIAEQKLAANIAELLNISCIHSNLVIEIHRGIRAHFHHFLDNFAEKSSILAQLGLAHSYSRSKVKFNVHKADNMVIQSIALLDQLDKDINKIAMRIREWYAYHFPELFKIVPEYYMYTKTAQFIGNRKTLAEDKLEQLEEIVMDSAKAQAILDASRSSMGMDISPMDLLNIDRCANRVIGLIELRANISEYLKNKMNTIAPNLSALIGEQVSARLISKAGSLTNLAKTPASTIQILGAEKALFRAIKTRGKTPKFGLLYNTTYIGKAGPTNKGRISRFLANKCSMASRIDCFSDVPSSIFGEKLKIQIEDRLKFYETGDIPAKNMDVMKEALSEYSDYKKLVEETSNKKKKKKRKSAGLDVSQDTLNGTLVDDSVVDKSLDDSGAPLKKKKKRKSAGLDVSQDTLNGTVVDDSVVDKSLDDSGAPLKKKKKKKSTNFDVSGQDISTNNGSLVEDSAVDDNDVVSKKKKKKSVG